MSRDHNIYDVRNPSTDWGQEHTCMYVIMAYERGFSHYIDPGPSEPRRRQSEGPHSPSNRRFILIFFLIFRELFNYL